MTATLPSPRTTDHRKADLKPLNYLNIYRAPPVDRIRIVKEGVSAVEAKRVIGLLWITRDAAYGALKLSAATVNRKAAKQETLSADEGERVIGVAKLIGQVEAMVADSGDGEPFDAAGWLSRWIAEPLPAFGGRPPVEFLDTMEGQGLVSDALAQMQSGAYA